MSRKLSALVVLAGVLAGCSKQPDKKAEASSKPPEPLMVTTVAAERRTVDKAVYVTGSLNPDETVDMSFEAQGRLAKINVDFGQSVRKGQVLAELDRQELSLQVDRAKAALSQALARLGLDPQQENIRPESTPAIRQAQAQMEDARSKYENAARLVKTGDIAQERFTELEKAFRARQAAVEAMQDEMRTQLANVQALKAEVKLAQKRLGDAQIYAPFDGAVSQKKAAVGQYIKDNVPVLTLVKTNPLRLRVDVPESATGVLKVGGTLRFTTDAVPGTSFQAVVRELNPSLDPKSRSLTVEARLLQNDPRLRPGMFVQVELVLSKNAEIVVVPQQAIYNLAGLNKLFVIRGGKAVELKITPGQKVDSWVEVPGEQVNAGDPVAVSALGQLVNGQAVQTKPGKA